MLEINLYTPDKYETCLRFYNETLQILGYTQLMNFEMPQGKCAGYGANDNPQFWISSIPLLKKEVKQPTSGHTVFQALTVEAIQAWYKKGLECGGKDNGKPSHRPEYHPGYYGAFLLDPSGNSLEACLHTYDQL